MEYWEPNQHVKGFIQNNELILNSSIKSAEGFECYMSTVINLNKKNNCIGIDEKVKEDCCNFIAELLGTVVIHKISEINKIKSGSNYVVINSSNAELEDYELYLECLNNYNLIFVDSGLADMILYYDIEFNEEITVNNWDYVQN